MSITYKEAMAELTAMFGGFDREMIKSVLVANNGDLEKTIEDLLKINEEALKENPQAFQEDEDDNIFSHLTTSSTKPSQPSNDNVFSIDDNSHLSTSSSNAPKKSTSSKPSSKSSSDDSVARRLQEQADEEYARQLQEDILTEAQTQPVRANRQQQQTHSSNYTLKPEALDQDQEDYPFEESEEEEEQDPEVEKKPKTKKPGFTTKLKSAFGGLFKKKKKNTDQEAQSEPKPSKQSTSTKEVSSQSQPKQTTSQSKVLTSKKGPVSKENEKVGQPASDSKLRPQTGDEEIYTFYFEGQPKFRFRPGFHQFNGQLEDENKENPVEFIVTDPNRNGYSQSMSKAQKNTKIDSEFFNFETS